MSRLSSLVDWSSLAIDVSPLRENRQFRLLFTGRLVSVAGLGMLLVVFSWQVYRLTGSSLQVALVSTTLGVFAFVGSLAGGVLADRFDRRLIILTTRGAAVLGLVAFAVNASVPEPSLIALYVIAGWDGATGGLSSSALAAAVPAVLTPRQLPAAGALMAITLDVGAVIGPLVAGFLVAVGGIALVGWVVVGFSALSWLVLFCLQPIATDRSEAEDHGGGLIADLREGMTFSLRDHIVGGVMLLGFIQILLASPYALIPELITSDLGGGPTALGVVYSAPAAGALIATILSGWTQRIRRIGRVLFLVFTGSCLGVAAFGAAPVLWVAVAAMAVVGALDVLAEIIRFTILSERTPDHLRGRVASLWSAQGTVGESLGGPALSLLAKPLGASGAIVAGGLLGAAATVTMLLTHRRLRDLTRDPALEIPVATEPPVVQPPAADHSLTPLDSPQEERP